VIGHGVHGSLRDSRSVPKTETKLCNNPTAMTAVVAICAVVGVTAGRTRKSAILLGLAKETRTRKTMIFARRNASASRQVLLPSQPSERPPDGGLARTAAPPDHNRSTHQPQVGSAPAGPAYQARHYLKVPAMKE
jgi:hypothetical protein